MAASVPYSLMDGKGGVAVGDVDPDTVRQGVEGDAHRGRRVQHRVGDQLGGEEGGASRHLGRQIAEVRRNPVACHGRAFDHRFEVQS